MLEGQAQAVPARKTQVEEQLATMSNLFVELEEQVQSLGGALHKILRGEDLGKEPPEEKTKELELVDLALTLKVFNSRLRLLTRVVEFIHTRLEL